MTAPRLVPGGGCFCGPFWPSAGWALRGGFPPDSGREPGFLRRKPEERAPGALPPGPLFFYGPLAVARSFWRLCRIVSVVGLLRHLSTCPDLETFFCKNAFHHIFFGKCVPNRFGHTGGNSRTTVPETTIPKTSEWQRAAIKPGVQGLAPGVLSPDFLQRKSGSPAGVGGARGRCAPRFRKSPDHPQGTQYRRP